MIYLVSMYYAPVVNPPANRMAQFNRCLSLSCGSESIRVVTGRPNYPDGVLRSGFRFHLWKNTLGPEAEAIIHLYEAPAPFRGLYRKTLGMVTFATSLWFFLTFRRYSREDLVIVTSGPGFNILAVYFASIFNRRLRFVLDIRDLWPQAVAGMGFLRQSGLPYRFLDAMVRKAYERAVALIGVEEGIIDVLSSYKPPQNVLCLRNPVDTSVFRPLPDNERESFRQEHPSIFVDGRRVVTYCGTFATYSGLPNLLAALALLSKARPDIHFLLIGQGEIEGELRSTIEKDRLQRQVTILPFQPREDCVKFINAGDACFAALKNDPVFESATPTKVLEYLACGMPVIAALDGPFAHKLKEGQTAHICSRGNPQALADLLSKVLVESGQISTSDARSLIEQEYGVSTFNNNLSTFLEPLIGSAE